jgi:hypothetical protein
MKRHYYLIIFIIGLLLRIAVGMLQKSPGFMDAEYYFISGRQLALGDGFTENILWNYLDDPDGIPHPSHGYWMPLASILAAFGMLVTQSHQFDTVQTIFILISSLLPPLTAYLCYLLTKDVSSAILAGGLAILSGFYLPFMTTTDTFGIYAVLGTTFFILFSETLLTQKIITPILIGIITGLMHLARTDGIIWLGIGLLGVLASTDSRSKQGKDKLFAYAEGLMLVIIGYLFIMGPWFTRNFLAFGSPLAPGGSRSLWITSYDEMFIYPANQLTAERWLSSGISNLLAARGWAFSINLQRSIAEQGLIFLSPFIILGLWQSRRDLRIKLGILAWLCTFLIMTFVFPYQGARGGFFHSSAALLALFWSAATIGFSAVLDWAHRVRNWNLREARIVFTIAILLFSFALTIFGGWNQFSKDDQNLPKWERNQYTYQKVEKFIHDLGAGDQEIVLAINPPGYFESSKRPVIAIPDGDISTTLEVARKYGASYLVLEIDHPKGLSDLYKHPRMGVDGLQYLFSISNTHLFLIE